MTGISGFNYVPALVNISSGKVTYTFTLPDKASRMSTVYIVDTRAFAVLSTGIYILDLSATPNFGKWTPFQVSPSGFSPTSIRVYVPSSNGPQITTITPTHGPQTGNSLIYIVGNNFISPAVFCRFGGVVVVNGTFLTNQLISCVIPPSPVPGVANVQVSNDMQVWSNSLPYTYDPVNNGKKPH